jgi:peptide/nickel transport system substrate-binding protein
VDNGLLGRREEIDGYDAAQAQEIQRDSNLKVVFSGGIGAFFLDFFDMWDPKSPLHDVRVRKAASLAIDRGSISEADTLGASKPTGNVVPRTFEFALPLEPDPYEPARAKRLLAEAGYPNGFDAGDLHAYPPYNSTTEAVGNSLAAIGIRTRVRTMERAAFFQAWATKKLKGVCMCVLALYGNAATRIAEWVPGTGTYAYGSFPDVDDLYKRQATELDRQKREALLHQIQQILHDRVRFAPIWDYTWPSVVGPRVEDAALMKIDPYPWSAPLEDVKLKRP